MHNAKHITARTRFLRDWRPGRKLAGIIGASVVVVAAGASYGGFALASSSTASTVIASTAVSNHPDTTNASGGTACTPTGGGPVWADDNYTSQMTAVNAGSGTWHVTIQDTGSFAGFADPTTCNAGLSTGSFMGLYTVTVTNAAVAPSASFLHKSYSGAVSTTQMVSDFFDNATGLAVAGGDYFFVYQGGNYVQTTSTIYGDVTANGGAVSGLHAVAVTATVAKLAWTATPGATGYAVKIISPTMGSVIKVGSNAITLTGLKPLTKYTVIVSAEPSSSGHAKLSFKTT